MNKKKTLKNLISEIGSSKSIYLGAVLALAAAITLGTAGDFLIKHVIDSVILSGAEFKYLFISGLLFLMLSLFRALFFYIEGKGKARTAENTARKMRLKIFDHIQRMSFKYHDKTGSGELIQRSTSDIDEVRRFYMDHMPGLLQIFLLYFINFTGMVILEWRLALTAAIITPFISFVSYYFFRKIHASYESYQEHEAHMTSRIQENLNNIRVVRAFARQGYEKRRFSTLNIEQRNRGFRIVFWHNLYWPIAHTLCSLQFVGILVAGAVMALNKEISPGTFIAFTAMSGNIIWPLQELGQIITELSKSFVSFERVNSILKEEREDTNVVADEKNIYENLMEAKIGNVSIRGEIRFRNLNFGYEKSCMVLRDIDIHIKSGEKIAILGETGSGKTTLINLLPRFYDYSEGEILLDGKPLSTYSKYILRESIGIVDQNPFLFTMSIAENIAYGLDREVSRKEIIEAARAAAIHDSIAQFQDGYDTMVGEKGVSLSGGQKQRITIARTILKNPRILIMDDSTSSVDTDTEEIITGSLKTIMKGRTTFIIAHRIKTLQIADRIIVMRRGRIIEAGTHEHLIKNGGFYHDVYTQQKGEAEKIIYKKPLTVKDVS